MQTPQSTIENADTVASRPMRCSQCGWPGIGLMPAGTQVVRQDGKVIVVGQLSYYWIRSVLCAVCQELESAVAGRPWFARAQAEYRNQVKAKQHLLNED